MKSFMFICANCKQTRTITTKKSFKTGNREELHEFIRLIHQMIKNEGWIKMKESEVTGFYDHLCPKCS